jgi:hypothetical protein
MGNGFSAAICKDKFDEISGMLNGRRDSGVGGNGEPLLSVPSTNNTSNPMETTACFLTDPSMPEQMVADQTGQIRRSVWF